jgi:hypothetical protein
MLIYKDGIVADYREIFKDTSFPSTGVSDEFLAENNAVKAFSFLPHDAVIEKLVACDPYIKDGFAYTVKVSPKTEMDLTADRKSKAIDIRNQRDGLLANSDWRVIKAMEQGVQLESAWALYRQALRDITNHPDFPNVDLPSEPN